MSGHLPGDDVRMARLEEKLRDEVLSKRDELFPEAKRLSSDDSIAFLPPAKRQAVQQLRDDYRELHRKLLIESGGDFYSNGASYITSADQQKRTYLDNEEEKDLQAVLTADEYKEMQLRNVWNEQLFKKAAAFLDLSEHQFRGLADIRAWREHADTKLGSHGVDPFAPMLPEIARQYQQIVDDENRKLVELLGAEKLQLMKLGEKPEYEGIARYIARFDLPQSHIAEYFTITSKGIDEAAALYNNPALSSEQRTESIKSIAKAYDASIAKLLGPTALDENLSMSAMLAPAARTSCFRVDENLQ